ncbi:uncharacterized protein LOC126981596 isoform X1 [Eriocheir sinensis]|uniref:uncharacterized protein LOC126981596 isoform X1 n=1 Tax=Eriocheir sinensis TaxID=95602 RepID=UPI0021C693C5|nr:uncharacterized protein LOC126981596 isoform X1 [Eriocheir sinensis]
MKARLPLLLVLFESSLLAAGVSFSPDLTPNCPAQIIILGAEEWANVYTEKYNWGDWSKILYVHPDQGFRGVRLLVSDGGWRREAWFTLDSTCFRGDVKWWWLLASVRNYEYENKDDSGLEFEVRAGDCSLKCHRTGHFPDHWNVTIEAQGPSRWRSDYPRPPCTVGKYTQQRFSLINCTTFFTTSTITTTTTPTITTTTPTTTTPTTTTTTPTTTTTIPTTTTTTPTTTTPTTTIIIIIVQAMMGVAFLVALMRRLRQRRVSQEVPCVPTRRGLAAFLRVGGEVAVGDSHVEPPMGPTMLPRVAPRQQEPDYLYFGDDEEHIYEEIPDPRIYQEIPELPPSREYENADSDDGTYLTPRCVPTGITSGHPPSRENENADSDDGTYLAPRCAPTGITSGHPPSRENENADSDDGTYLAPRCAPTGITSGHPPSREYENADSDDGTYLAPRCAPTGITSGHPPSREYENADSDDGTYLAPRCVPTGTPSGITEG